MNRGGGDESKCSQIFTAFILLGVVALLGMGVVVGVGTIAVIDMNHQIDSYQWYQFKSVKYERDLTEWNKKLERGKVQKTYQITPNENKTATISFLLSWLTSPDFSPAPA